jgi:hypothetical protein
VCVQATAFARVHHTGSVLCPAVLCCAVLCCAVLCCAVLCCAVLCRTSRLLHCTKHRYERATLPDGRRCNRWYLIDQHGVSHLAVIGIERDTKDGHYVYAAVRCRVLHMPCIDGVPPGWFAKHPTAPCTRTTC